jgi:hypothetical protein
MRASLGKNWRAYLKNKLKQKRAEHMAQVTEYLPSKCKALSLNLSVADIFQVGMALSVENLL